MECIICFYDINNKSEYYQCSYCIKNVHKQCYYMWWGTGANIKTCIYCCQENGLVLKNKSAWRTFKNWVLRCLSY